MADFRDFMQGMSNSAASTVSAPVDGLAWLLRKAGVPMGAPVGGSDWMAAQGLTAEPVNKNMGLLGEAVGGVSPMLAMAKAPQIAGGLLQMGDNAMAPTTLNKQAGLIVNPNGKIAANVKNLKGERVEAPTTFYRGETPGAERVQVKNSDWDASLYAADSPQVAGLYGKDITKMQAKPGANIVYEGTKEFNSLMSGYGNKGSMVDWGAEAQKRARKAGFDAVWFKRQSDIGTAILDRSKFEINGQLINNTGGLR